MAERAHCDHCGKYFGENCSHSWERQDRSTSYFCCVECLCAFRRAWRERAAAQRPKDSASITVEFDEWLVASFQLGRNQSVVIGRDSHGNPWIGTITDGDV